MSTYPHPVQTNLLPEWASWTPNIYAENEKHFNPAPEVSRNSFKAISIRHPANVSIHSRSQNAGPAISCCHITLCGCFPLCSTLFALNYSHESGETIMQQGVRIKVLNLIRAKEVGLQTTILFVLDVMNLLWRCQYF